MNPEMQPRRREWIRVFILASIVLIVLLGFVMRYAVSVNLKDGRAKRIRCENNLNQIGLAFRLWATDHQDQFPFNVSTNKGGTREFCDRDTNGFDRNAFRHLMIMSNELSTTITLLCPLDTNNTRAVDFAHVGPENLSYQIRSGMQVNETNPNQVLAVCPIHGSFVHADGSLQKGK